MTDWLRLDFLNYLVRELSPMRIVLEHRDRMLRFYPVVFVTIADEVLVHTQVGAAAPQIPGWTLSDPTEECEYGRLEISDRPPGMVAERVEIGVQAQIVGWLPDDQTPWWTVQGHAELLLEEENSDRR